MLWPWAHFDPFQLSRIYRYFPAVAPECVWGSVCFLLGSTYLWAAYVRKVVWLRRACALISTALFSIIVFAFWRASPGYLGIAVYSILALTNALVFFRVRRRT